MSPCARQRAHPSLLPLPPRQLPASSLPLIQHRQRHLVCSPVRGLCSHVAYVSVKSVLRARGRRARGRQRVGQAPRGGGGSEARGGGPDGGQQLCGGASGLEQGLRLIPLHDPFFLFTPPQTSAWAASRGSTRALNAASAAAASAGFMCCVGERRRGEEKKTDAQEWQGKKRTRSADSLSLTQAHIHTHTLKLNQYPAASTARPAASPAAPPAAARAQTSTFWGACPRVRTRSRPLHCAQPR